MKYSFADFMAVKLAVLYFTRHPVSYEKHMKKLIHCTYVLYSLKDKLLYIGYSSDLKERLTRHFQGESLATAPRRPFRLIYCEYFVAKADAMRRENYFKTTAGKKTLKLMLRESLKEVE